jgi:hypothetical protein
MPQEKTSDIFINSIKVNSLIQVTVFLKLNIKIEAILAMEELNNNKVYAIA